MRWQVWLAAALGLGLCAPALAQEVPGPVVAVFDIQTKLVSFPKDVLDGLADYLGTLLAKHGYQVVPRSQLRARLTAEKTASYKECYEESCQIEIGKELAADKSLATQILRLGGQCKVTVTLFDLKKATSERAGTHSSDKCDEKAVVESLELAVDDLAGVKAAEPAPVEPGVPAPRPAGLGPALAMMVKIPAGDFWMGCSLDDFECIEYEKPNHKVYLSEFWIDATEVTVAAYKRCVDVGRCKPPKLKEGEDESRCTWGVADKLGHPVNCVDWYRAEAYCKWAGKRLPTEAEWEKAARGGSIAKRYGELDEIAWHNEPLSTGARPVGQKRPNDYGLYDVLGNVSEWCADWFGDDYYKKSPTRDPKGVSSESRKVLRGGGWLEQPTDGRVSDRAFPFPASSGDTYGLRCASSRAP